MGSGLLFGKNLRRLRESLGMSQSDLGKLLDVRQGTISSWESGVTGPTWAETDRLMRIFNVPFSEFTKEEVVRYGPPMKQKATLNEALEVIDENWDKLELRKRVKHRKSTDH